MVLVIVLVLLIIGTLIFHFASPWWFTPLASNWQSIDNTINITFWVTGLVFIAVNSFLAYAVFRYRFQKTRKADYQPENKKLESWLLIGTSLGVAAMLAPGLFVWDRFIHVPENANTVEAVAQQWSWSFRLPGADGKLGQTAVEFINARNPFGIAPDDTFGQDDILINSNEMHLPLGQPIKVQMRSKDVLHSFAVPQFRVKMDMVPGIESYLWFTPTRLGRFELLCQELCGLAHYTMRGVIQVDSPEDFQTWLDKQQTFAQSLQQTAIDIDLGRNVYGRCSACHGSSGEGNVTLNAPALAGQGSWYLVRQINYFRNGVRGAHPQDPLGQQMAVMAATLSDTDVTQVAAYIASLTPSQTEVPVIGDHGKGKRLYHNCSFCHGALGEGNYSQNTPRISAQHDWYLRRQLVNYQQGIRGSHPQDLFGKQMIMMSRLLQSPQAVDDLLSYLATLPVPSDKETKVAQTSQSD